jgi:hypothetical protein
LSEKVEKNAMMSLRELNTHFEDEGVETTGSGINVEMTGSSASVWVPSYVPQ